MEKSRYFIKNHDVNPELGEIFSGFKGDYLNVVKIMFLMNLKNITMAIPIHSAWIY
ncbi:MAG: hypothetical protein ACLTTH_14930 [Holdemanella porci]